MTFRSLLPHRSKWPVVALPSASPWPVGRVGVGGAFEEFGALPVPLEAIVRWDPAGRLWALDPVTRTVTGYAVDGDDLREFAAHPLPPGFFAADMAIDERRIYLGGAPRRLARRFEPTTLPDHDATGPMAWYRDLSDASGWSALPMPMGEHPEKSVDALVLDGDHLVAVDDLIVPKWFFVFDRRVSGTPFHVRTVELAQDTYESTCAGAAVSSQWIALRSDGVGSGGSYRVLTLFARGSLETRGCFETYISPRAELSWDGQPRQQWKSSEWGGAAFVGERLLVAALQDGLLEFDCTNIGARVEDPDDDSRGADLADRMRRVKVRYASRVLDVIPVEAWRGAFLIVERGRQRLAVWHPVAPSPRR